jgi:3-oxoacyl-[acyl-carrier-protein] synthase-1/3-oxoacyl-[acyl-carrier-protein] synthase II
VPRAYLCGVGIVSPAGQGYAATLELLRGATTAIRPLSVFPPGAREPLPVGEVPDLSVDGGWPRTHALALVAAKEALASTADPPDAVVLGGTTGGMPRSEVLLRDGDEDPVKYRLHGLGTVADHLAAELGCTGPVLTVSTACSSGAVALKIGLELIRAGMVRRVLAGGVDGLCRLTYHGFGTLKLIDPAGARPLDAGRAGMSVGEAAAMLLLVAGEAPPEGAVAELLGGGLSCDAYHPSAPHPEGKGAIAAMSGALQDAGLAPDAVSYVNLHGTGTPDNDAAEARAVRALFGEALPPLSSTKGALSHTLAAAGALEAAIAAMALRHGLVPANTGLDQLDPGLGLEPAAVVREPREAPVEAVLSNSFGFGGNNAALVLGRPEPRPDGPTASLRPLQVLAAECVTGAGHTEATLERLLAGEPCGGVLDDRLVTEGLPRRALRRLKRLSRLVLALAARASGEATPHGVFYGTSWGALSETHDFLTKLFESSEEFSSPTDFVGSVHNAVAGQVAIRHGATGPNVTATGGDASFFQALYSAALLAEAGRDQLLLGADEAQPALTPLFDASARGSEPSDGGAALLVRPGDGGGPYLLPRFYAVGRQHGAAIGALLRALGGTERYGALLVGIPAADRRWAGPRLAQLLERSGFSGPVIDYRRLTGEYAAAAATAAVLAVKLVRDQVVPAALAGGGADLALEGRRILLLGLGQKITATEVGCKQGTEDDEG